MCKNARINHIECESHHLRVWGSRHRVNIQNSWQRVWNLTKNCRTHGRGCGTYQKIAELMLEGAHSIKELIARCPRKSKLHKKYLMFQNYWLENRFWRHRHFMSMVSPTHELLSNITLNGASSPLPAPPSSPKRWRRRRQGLAPTKTRIVSTLRVRVCVCVSVGQRGGEGDSTTQNTHSHIRVTTRFFWGR